MDVSADVLTAQHRAAGLRLLELDDDVVILSQHGNVVQVFSQSVVASAILKVADYWAGRQTCVAV